MICKRIHLTPRGEWVRDGLGAVLAFLVLPGTVLIAGKLIGL